MGPLRTSLIRGRWVIVPPGSKNVTIFNWSFGGIVEVVPELLTEVVLGIHSSLSC